MTLDIPHSKIREWNSWMAQIRDEWVSEVPSRINTNETDEGHGLGGPAFAPEFVNYMGYLFCARADCLECKAERRKIHRRANPESRVRATRAMNKLRRVAPREFDVVYSVCILGVGIQSMADNLTARGHETYDSEGVLVLLMSGIDKVIHFWRST